MTRILSTLEMIGVAIALTLAAGAVPIVRFTNETITVLVAPAEVRVDAVYGYENPYRFPVRQGLSLPLPRGPEPVDISLHRGAEIVPMHFLLGRYYFELPFHARERMEVRLRYRQFAPDRHAQYLLKTTKPWRRPLAHGRYTVKERGVTLTRSSYELRRLTAGQLEFSRTNFMPNRDWELDWQIP